MTPPPTRTRKPSGLKHLRARVANFFDSMEPLASQFFGEGMSPFSLAPAIFTTLLIICAATGIILMFHYVPDPDRATIDIFNITHGLKGGELLRATHRFSSDFLVISLIFYILRTWVRGQFRGPLKKSWVMGILLFPVLGVIGWSGYVLGWDERAIVLLSMGKEIAFSADTWPIVGWLRPGSIFAWPIFSATSEYDIILRIFMLHAGGFIVALWLWVLHLRKFNPPRIMLPFTGWIVLILLVIMAARTMTVETELIRPFNPYGIPLAINVDGVINFPLLFYPLLGAPLLAALMIAVWVAIAAIPGTEPLTPVAAVIRESRCTGCRLCLQDCPYNAIRMVPHPDQRRKIQGREIARIICDDCTACGVCVGSCGFDAIDLPELTSGDILDRVNRVMKSHWEKLELEKKEVTHDW